jgi:hypothetical protein
MSEEHKSASPSAIQVKNLQKTIDIEAQLCVIMRSEKAERIVNIFLNVRPAYGILRKIRDNADRIKERAKSGTKVFL